MKSYYWRTATSVALAVALLATGKVASAGDDDWTTNTPYYEDDAWYDVSEWLDGNDYNPTDEAIGRWDDEVYDRDVESSDSDNDVAYGDSDYGYDSESADDDWYYDYDRSGDYTYYDTYGNGADDSKYTYGTTFYDFDRDGLYDYYSIYHDSDADGLYDEIYTYTFDSSANSKAGAASKKSKNSSSGNESQQDKASSAQKQAQKSQRGSQDDADQRQSPEKTWLTGTIEKMKTVKVRGDKHVVVQLKREDQSNVIADLGAESDLKDVNIKEGVKIELTGAMTKAGEKKIVLADTLAVNGKTHAVDRSPKTITGKIVDTREIKLRGNESTLIVVKTDDDKKYLVDAGSTQNLKKANLKKDAEIKVRGVPVKAKDKRVVIAKSIEVDGEKVKVDRRSKNQGNKVAQF